MRTLLTTVSDDRFGRKEGGYKKTQDLISSIVKNYLGTLGLEIRQWDFEGIKQTAFYQANKVLLDNLDPARNGRAYKPFVIYEALQNVDFGDYVIYNDCSPELWQIPFVNAEQPMPSKYSLTVLHDLVKQNRDILTCFVKWDTINPPRNGLGIHTHANFTMDKTIERMGMQAHKYDFQHASGFMAIRKTDETIEFVREWMHWNCIPECACMGWPGIKDDYGFWDGEQHRKMGHRHDQSISGLLLNKRGAMLVDMPPYEGMNPFNFLQYCRLDVKYQFISSINPKGIPGPHEILKGSQVRNAEGIELTVYEFQPENNIEWVVVGKNRGSTYRTTRNNLTLISQ